MSKSNALWVILGNQLFPVPALKKLAVTRVYMAEDDGLCTHFRYHKQKLVLFLTAMRRYAAELRDAGIDVHYDALEAGAKAVSYEAKLAAHLKKAPASALHFFEIEDKFMERRLLDFAQQRALPVQVQPTLMFLTRREQFAEYLRSQRRPFMKTFYAWQRTRLGLLVDKNGAPAGGRWSFDTENRKKLPKTVSPPPTLPFPRSPELEAVSRLVDERFPKHPGHTSDFWFPTNRKEALRWLADFLENRLAQFGAYEDAMARDEDTVFHSVLTPALNCGLLVPAEVVKKTLSAAERQKVPLPSLEGFLRQVIGWREFIRGIYQEFSDTQESKNFFGHHRRLNDAWYEGTTGIEPIDNIIRRVQRLGWCHHIERLMVLSNAMLLCEVHPHEVHRWFMEMFVDSSDWVMGPNVYGMGQFSDGGIFATKPYIGASNYILKMSDYRRGDWCDDFDALFWSFLGKHAAFFQKNPRLNMLVKSWEKRDASARQAIVKRADDVRKRLTRS